MIKIPGIKYFVPMFLIWLLMSCAAEAPASGGPEDTASPSLVSVTPENASTNLPADAAILLKFDDSIDPLSVPAAILVAPEVEIHTRTRRNQITITPVNGWPEDTVIRIELTRSIRDYRKNEIEFPVQLTYSTGETLPQASIAGTLRRIDPEKKVELGLYTYPLTDSSQFVRKIEAAQDGTFMFDHLTAGDYILNAIEGELYDFATDYRSHRYGMMTGGPIALKDSSIIEGIELQMSDPLGRMAIKSIEFQNQQYFTLTYNDGSEESLSLQQVLADGSGSVNGDTVTLALTKTNKLEFYTVTPYSFILPTITDTLPPIVTDHFFQDYYYQIKFSEPVSYFKDTTGALPFFVEGILDTERTIYFAKWRDDHTLEISDIKPKTNKIQLNGNDFIDLSGNFMADSVVTLNINWTDYPKHLPTGDILGAITYSGLRPLVVAAKHLETDETYYTDANDRAYVFKGLPPGNYTLQTYEKLNQVNGELYFSGIWVPYQPAARSIDYPDTVEVRARWSVEGVDFNF